MSEVQTEDLFCTKSKLTGIVVCDLTFTSLLMLQNLNSFTRIRLVALLIIFAGCDARSPSDQFEKKFQITDVKPVLFNNDHNSEGFLVQKNDGNLLLIFRVDPGIEGSHTGTDGYIAQITYYPDEDRWGELQKVYNSNRYDDRNIHGGITNDGRIVLFFRHMDIVNGRNSTVERFFMYSDDDGESWSGPDRSGSWSAPGEPDPRFGVWGTGQMFYNEEVSRYSMPGYGNHILYMTQSEDGSNWDEISFVKEDEERVLTEIAAAWTGNKRLIALIRDNRTEPDYQLLQIESRDNGETWSEPQRTNMPENHWGAAPQLIYDQNRDLLIAMVSDRNTRDHSENSLFIYSASPDEVYENPGNWSFEYEITRPWADEIYRDIRPLNLSFYGYPTIAPINENEYLVVFTERASMDGTEQADLYYFRLVSK